jgi:uncharacterized protein YyaL (SSP411 family)
VHPAWREWTAEAFARAGVEDKPVLLSIVTAWSEECAAMDRTTYADRDVAALIEARFVPVRVDADRRPDLNERYNLGGWPTTAFLTAGGQILAGGTYFSAADMKAALAQVARSARGLADRRVPLRQDRGKVSTDAGRRSAGASAVEDFRALLLEQFDPVHGGFGSAPKLPHPYALLFALSLSRDSGDAELARMIDLTLEGTAKLWDPDAGGFRRYADAEDWTQTGPEKLLEDNAALLHAYVEAALVGRAQAADRAGALVRWVKSSLSDQPNAGFYNAQTARGVDPSMYVDRNAMMAGAFIRAAALFDDIWLRDFALKSLESVIVPAYVPGDGVAHVAASGGASQVRGLLTDQVHVAGALIWAHAATGQLPYSMLAAELMESAIRKMWDEGAGRFRDRAASDDPLLPFELNCHAASVLDRLSVLTGDRRYQERAIAVLESLTPEYRQQGLFAAPYALAVREVFDRQPPAGLALTRVDWKLG